MVESLNKIFQKSLKFFSVRTQECHFEKESLITLP